VLADDLLEPLGVGFVDLLHSSEKSLWLSFLLWIERLAGPVWIVLLRPFDPGGAGFLVFFRALL
jgi:hypothetical protein